MDDLKLRERIAETIRRECYGNTGGGVMGAEYAADAILSLLPSLKEVESDAEPVAWRAAVQEAVDLLREQIWGNSARSPGHNARLVLERLLASSPPSPVPALPVPNPQVIADLFREKGASGLYEAAYRHGWRDREDDFIARTERASPPSPDPDGGGGWRPIKTAPDGVAVDIWVAPLRGGVACRVPNCWRENGRWLHGNGLRVWDQVSHWMPCPLPPSPPREVTHDQP